MFTVNLYARETWTLKKADRTALLVFEMYCYRWILHVKRLDKIRNSEIRRRLLVKGRPCTSSDEKEAKPVRTHM